MQLLLESNEAFHFLCPTMDDNDDNSSNVCSAQTNALIRVQLIAQSLQMAAPLLGYGVDRCGARRAYFVLTLLILLALLILFITTSLSYYVTGSDPHVDRWLYVAFALLSMGVSVAAILIVQAGLFFHGRTQQRVISILNALFDAGAITYLFLWLMYNKGGASITTVFAAYFGVAGLIFGTGMYFWSVAVPESIHTTDGSISDNQNVPLHNVSPTNDDGTTDVSDIVRKETPTNRTNHTSSSSVLEEDVNEGEDAAYIADPAAAENGCIDAVHSDHIEPEDTKSNSLSKANSYVLICDRTRRKQLTSAPALCLAVFVGVHATSNNWTMGTIRDFLAYLGDDDYDNRYLTLFTLLTPVSLLGLPFVDHIMHHYGFHVAFQSVNVLGFGYTIIRLCSSNLNVQVFGFIIFAFFRCFLYSVFQSFVPTLFSADVAGLCIGLLIGIPGIGAFLNLPLANYIIKVADGNFYVANLMYTLLILPCVMAAYCIGRTIRHEHQIRLELKKESDDQLKIHSSHSQDNR
jgi:MFS family permease